MSHKYMWGENLFFITNPFGTLGNQSFSHILCRHGRIKKCSLYFVLTAYRSTFITHRDSSNWGVNFKIKSRIVLCFGDSANYLIMQIVMLAIWTRLDGFRIEKLTKIVFLFWTLLSVYRIFAQSSYSIKGQTEISPFRPRQIELFCPLSIWLRCIHSRQSDRR